MGERLANLEEDFQEMKAPASLPDTRIAPAQMPPAIAPIPLIIRWFPFP
jgi:hypothetical protein